MRTLRGIAQPSDWLLIHVLLAYWRKFLVQGTGDKQMWCSDPWVEHMKGYGYSIVRLPKADVKPLLLLSSQGKILDRLGDLTTVFVAGGNIPLPPISENNEAANVSASARAT
jgi:hypothetical protein